MIIFLTMMRHSPQASWQFLCPTLSHFPPCRRSPYTKDFVDILEAITQSGFYTEDPEKACIFVPPFNLLNEQNLDPILASKG